MVDLDLELYNVINTSGYDIYSNIAPQNKTFPFVIYNNLIETETNGLNETTTVQNVRYQIDIYSKTNKEKNQIKNNIKNLIKNSNLNVIIYSINNNDNDEIFRSTIDLKIWSNN